MRDKKWEISSTRNKWSRCSVWLRQQLSPGEKRLKTSREELLRAVTDLNSEMERRLAELRPSRPERACKKVSCQDFHEVIFGSMDVKSLYPNCKLKEASSHIRTALGLVETNFEQTDRRFMLKYLGLTVGKTNTTLDLFIPVPKGTTTLHSMVTNETPGQFHDPEECADHMSQTQIRQAVGWVMSKALEVTYRHHHYTVGGAVHRQHDGGSQGLNTAVEASELYMLIFNKRFLELLRTLGLVLLLYLMEGHRGLILQLRLLSSTCSYLIKGFWNS